MNKQAIIDYLEDQKKAEEQVKTLLLALALAWDERLGVGNADIEFAIGGKKYHLASNVFGRTCRRRILSEPDIQGDQISIEWSADYNTEPPSRYCSLNMDMPTLVAINAEFDEISAAFRQAVDAARSDSQVATLTAILQTMGIQIN